MRMCIECGKTSSRGVVSCSVCGSMDFISAEPGLKTNIKRDDNVVGEEEDICPDCGSRDQLGDYCSECGISMALRSEDLIDFKQVFKSRSWVYSSNGFSFWFIET